MYYLLDNALDSFEARGVTDDDIAKFKGGYEVTIDKWFAKCSR